MSELEWFSKFEKEPPLNQTIVVENLYGGNKPYVYCKRTKGNTYKSIDGTPRRDFDFEFWAISNLNNDSYEETMKKAAKLFGVDEDFFLKK
jgi:hypothetical protein